ncbi:MAG: 1,2-phenylacetyl-CoA epoxidase subunit PaaD [Burkholderiaceae bacterium]
MVSTQAPQAEAGRVARAWAVLDGVPDPEVPALSVRDLGIVRDVIDADGTIEVVLTPTYSGCPATEDIERSVLAALEQSGLGRRARLQRAPAWTTDWISDAGRRKLRDYGIAPPGACAPDQAVPIRFVGRRAGAATEAVACPRCESTDTECLSAFGSTACKALYRCRACREPFEYFKPI